MGASDLRIGTSGWNYPSGRGTWNGIFYPPSRGRAKGFDELSFYAEHFNTVEVNSTFYGQPRAEVTSRLGASGRRRASSSPSSCIRSSRIRRCSRRRSPKGVPAGDAAAEALLDALARPNQSDLDEFRRGHRSAGLERQAGRAARAVSAELQGQPGRRATICRGCSRRSGLPRGRRTAAQQLERRDRRHAGAAQPVRIRAGSRSTSRSSGCRSDRTSCRTCRGFYYMRLHGRNAKQWWTHEKAEDRYNYLYTAPRSQRVRRNRRRRAADS